MYFCNNSPILTCRLCQNTFCYAGAIAFSNARFGGGFGRRIFLDDVDCSGLESMLTQCPANPIGNHNCVHEEDAGVQCALSGMIAWTVSGRGGGVPAPPPPSPSWKSRQSQTIFHKTIDLRHMHVTW